MWPTAVFNKAHRNSFSHQVDRNNTVELEPKRVYALVFDCIMDAAFACLTPEMVFQQVRKERVPKVLSEKQDISHFKFLFISSHLSFHVITLFGLRMRSVCY